MAAEVGQDRRVPNEEVHQRQQSLALQLPRHEELR